MFSPQEQIPTCSQRTPPEATISIGKSANPNRSERRKLSIQVRTTAFYDSLSTIHLTPRALKELDQRTCQVCYRQHSPTVYIYPAKASDIRRFARQGGPDLRDLRGYPVISAIRSRDSISRSEKLHSSAVRRTSAYDEDFVELLARNHIYMSDGTSELDLKEIHHAIELPRRSLSPSRFPDTAYADFRRKKNVAVNEVDVMRNVIPILCGDDHILHKEDLTFTRLHPITNHDIVTAKPDFYDGAHANDVNGQVRRDIGKYIIPTAHHEAPVVPNFFLEVKSHMGVPEVAKRQICYDGAFGARAIHKLQCYRQEPFYDGKPYTITASYSPNGLLSMYVTHITSPGHTDQGPAYHMTELGFWHLFNGSNACRQAISAFRNMRDMAKEHRDRFILAANNRANASQQMLPPPLPPRCSPHISQQGPLESVSGSSTDDNNSNSTDAKPTEESESSLDECLAQVERRTSEKRLRLASDEIVIVSKALRKY